MHFDTDSHLREVSLRLASSADADEALERLFEHLRRGIAVDGLFLNYQDGLGTIYCLGCAGPFARLARRDGGAPLMLLHPAVASRLDNAGTGRAAGCPHVAINNAPHPPLVEAAFLSHFPVAARWPSLLSLNLDIGGEVLGSLEVVREGGGFGPDDARLFQSIKEPLALALLGARRTRELRQLRARLAEEARAAERPLALSDVVGAGGGLEGVMALVRRVAPLAVPVLLLGETGTGKEVIAQAIHAASPRRNRPMVRVQCGAIPDTLIDSELFGHEKGAFTGAVGTRRGRFELADGGTIFLDEIGELSPPAQVKLLRVLQEREVERLGDHRVITVDVRVIAATHRDLGAMIRSGAFREDLYYRLSLFPVRLPPLRERRGDLHALASHFARRAAEAMGLSKVPRLPASELAALEAHPWPGNVRELRNVVERALIIGGDGPLRFDLPGPRAPAQPPGADAPLPVDAAGPGREPPTIDEAMAELIRGALEDCGGRVEGESGAARRLGIHPSTLRARMRKLGIAYGRRAR